MTTSAVSATTPSVTLAPLAIANPTAVRNDDDGDSDQGARDSVRGGKLFSALLAALTQFVSNNSAASAAGGTSPAASASTPATSTNTGAAVPSTLPQDLHAFLHDLFRALRQEGRVATGTPASGTSSPTPPVTAGVPTPATPPATPTSSGSVRLDRYGQHGLIAELQGLINDLGSNPVPAATTATTTTTTTGSSATPALTQLNAAFAKLITDLGGSTSTASLSSFLTGFLENLQGASGGSTSPLGNRINVSA